MNRRYHDMTDKPPADTVHVWADSDGAHVAIARNGRLVPGQRFDCRTTDGADKMAAGLARRLHLSCVARPPRTA